MTQSLCTEQVQFGMLVGVMNCTHFKKITRENEHQVEGYTPQNKMHVNGFGTEPLTFGKCLETSLL